MITYYYNGEIHSLDKENNIYSCIGIKKGKIIYLGNEVPNKGNKINLLGNKIYPSFSESHTHLLYSIISSASSFNICEITNKGIIPNTIDGIKEKIINYSKNSKEKIIIINNYIRSAIKEQRLPTKQELDEWTNYKDCVCFNIDGHSASLSSSLITKLNIIDKNNNGILCDKEYDLIQGKITSHIAKSISLSTILKGISEFQNTCAKYGITRVCALDGEDDLDKDSLLSLLIYLCRRIDIDVKLFPQYMNLRKLRNFSNKLKNKRAGGCSKCELDGSVGSNSAAFYIPYNNGKISDCYYTQSEINEHIKQGLISNIQLSNHAIGEKAIDQICKAYELNQQYIPKNGPMPRIEHFEFPSKYALNFIKNNRLAITIQPGFSYIDKRYLNSYTQYLPEDIINKQTPLKELAENNIIFCGSSDSPVQSINPFTQMLGMIDFYIKEQSISPIQAIKSYTINPAIMMGEESEYGSLEINKEASFFITSNTIEEVNASNILEINIHKTILRGKVLQQSSNKLITLLKLLFHKTKLI